jgi:hypothetical protein
MICGEGIGDNQGRRDGREILGEIQARGNDILDSVPVRIFFLPSFSSPYSPLASKMILSHFDPTH